MALSTIKKVTLMLLAVLAAAMMLSACSNTGTNTDSTSKTMNGTEYAYITSYDKSDSTITIDKVEWITKENTSRINELDLDVNKDFTNGYYIYNTDKNDLRTYDLADNVVVITKDNNTTNDVAEDIAEDKDTNTNTSTNNTLVDNSDTANKVNNTTNDLVDSISDMFGVDKTPFKITIKDGNVTRIEEAYYDTTNNNTTTNTK